MAYLSLSTLKKSLLFVILQLIVIWLIYEKREALAALLPFRTYVPSVPYRGLANGTKSESGVFHLPLYQYQDMKHFYAEVGSDVWCFRDGMDEKKSLKNKKCSCHLSWYGLDCGIPASVWDSNFLQKGKRPGVWLKRKDRPRRVILVILFKDQYSILRFVVRNLSSVVDVFVIGQYGVRNDSELNLSTRLAKGFLKDFQYKLVHIVINPSGSAAKGKWFAAQTDAIVNWYLWQKVTDFRPDDIFVFTDTFSIISKHVMVFLKLYTGYPEPIYLYLNPPRDPSLCLPHTSESNCNRSATALASTFDFLRVLCKFDIGRFRAGLCRQDHRLVQKFVSQHWPVKRWRLGTKESPAGWTCQPCLNAQEIPKELRHVNNNTTYNMSKQIIVNSTNVKS